MLAITPIHTPLLASRGLQLDVLRLDIIHPQISGNKWYKLKYNIAQAKREHKTSLVSFGGAYSNHLHALAYAGCEAGLSTIGYIRGEEVTNPTLQDCMAWGMQLHFVSRSEYKHKQEEEFLSYLQQTYPDALIIPEGGSNELGLQGCKEILSDVGSSTYHYLACAIGTGTTFAGMANAVQEHQHAIGFTAMKGGEYLQSSLVEKIPHSRWSLETDYAFGGFGKKNEELIRFLTDFKNTHDVELDFVYTAKMMAGLLDKVEKNYFSEGTKILAIHTGGIQGNRSLSKSIFG